ncbi:MAG TPA: winged helix-turn-helix domain-containing protein [Propionibacteriaceae bacterium]|nr:winged helix-turn-helix domain-containing protein [Propionibacteriaceae bacterium]
MVEVHISSLRRRLEAHGPRVIHTVRGQGYRLGEP